MDCLTFISSLVSSLAWPGALLVIFFAIRKQVPKIISSIRRFSYGDFSVEFAEVAQAMEQAAKDAASTTGQDALLVGGRPREAVRKQLLDLVESAPRAAIIQAWLYVEGAGIDAVRKAGVATVSSSPGPMRLRDYLKKGGLLNGVEIAIFEQLRELRNAAVHSQEAEFTPESVRNFIDASLFLAARLEYSAQSL